MIKVYIFNKSNNVAKFNIFKKFFEHINSEISLTCCTGSLSKCAWQWEENGKFDIPVDSLLLEDTSWWVLYDQFEDCFEEFEDKD